MLLELILTVLALVALAILAVPPLLIILSMLTMGEKPLLLDKPESEYRLYGESTAVLDEDDS